MAVNQAKIIQALEQLDNTSNKSEFIYAFLKAYNFPKNTVTLLKTGSSRNVAKIANHIGLKNKLYFQPLALGESIDDALETLIKASVVASNKIRFVIVTDFVQFGAYNAVPNKFSL